MSPQITSSHWKWMASGSFVAANELLRAAACVCSSQAGALGFGTQPVCVCVWLRNLWSWLILWIKSTNAILSEMFSRILSFDLRPSLFLNLSLSFFLLLFYCLYTHPTHTSIPSLIKSLVSSSTSHQSLPHLHTSICWMQDHTLSLSLQRCITDPVHCSCSFGVYGSAKLVKTQLRSVGKKLCELNKLLKVFSYQNIFIWYDIYDMTLWYDTNDYITDIKKC